MEITDEMRHAVRVEQCAELGHDLDINPMMFKHYPAPLHGKWCIQGQPGRLPHIACRRCGLVWLVVEDPGDGYDDALSRLRARIVPGDPLHVDRPQPEGVQNGHLPEHVHVGHPLPPRPTPLTD